MAFSMSPPVSSSAARQSLKPALVRSRSSLTSCAGMLVCSGFVLMAAAGSFCLDSVPGLLARPVDCVFCRDLPGIARFFLFHFFRRIVSRGKIAKGKSGVLPARVLEELALLFLFGGRDRLGRRLPLRRRLPLPQIPLPPFLPPLNAGVPRLHKPRYLRPLFGRPFFPHLGVAQNL